MRIVGTAGHVDHGKSTLVAALTGINPDRLQEEIDREMTIDLGFAAWTLPNGEQVGIIDVPGHRDFIGNMLAGIGGIDVVLLIIAADESVSAQTREHLDILDLLHVHKGIIVLTKIDLVTDPDWLELVELEARELVQGTSLENAPVVGVSARSGAGLDDLTHTLEALLATVPAKADLGRPRLPIDRVFTLTGFGTVVTGTLLDGSFALGDEIVCLPSGLSGRIRGLQNHNQKVQKARPGFRTAINLTGIDKDQIQRGDVIAHPKAYLPSNLIDVHFRYLNKAAAPFKHNTTVRLFLGSGETLAQARLLGTDKLGPGESGFLQLSLKEPVVAVRGDRFILRLPSPSETLGGGSVLDAQPGKRHRRFNEALITHLEALLAGSDQELVLQFFNTTKIMAESELLKRLTLPKETARQLIAELLEEAKLILLQDDPSPQKRYLSAQAQWQELSDSILRTLAEFHADKPLKLGLSKEDLHTGLPLNQTQFDIALDYLRATGQITQNGVHLSLSSHRVALSEEQMASATPLLKLFAQAPYSPPGYNEAADLIGAALLDGLIAAGILVRVSDQVLLTSAVYAEMTEWVKTALTAQGQLSLAEVRDHFKTSRKYAAALLEYLDKIGVTLRRGDQRVLRRVQLEK